MNCTICGSNLAEPAFTGRILAKYDTGYFHCRECGHLQTESPFWLKEAYEFVDRHGLPEWVQLNKETHAAKLVSYPARDQLTLPINEQLIVELYSK